MTLTLPEGYTLAKVESGIVLARRGGFWATWEMTGEGLVSGHYFCDHCPGAEDLARADFAKRVNACR